jgi:ABC-type glycerol-3-phosphate transport system substrate-binding protein
MNRRTVLATLGTVATIGPLAACGQSESASAPKLDLKGITIEHWNSNAPTHPEELGKKKVLESFNAQNTQGIQVKFNDVADASATDLSKVITALAAGTPPDLYSTHNFFASDLFNRGATADVDAELKGDAEWKKVRPSVYPGIIQGLSWKGKLTGVPNYNSYFLLYYHAGLLKRAGLQVPPSRTWTWDDFMRYARTAASPPDVTAYDSGWIYPDLMMTALNNGAQFVSADGTKFQLSSPEVQETVEWEYAMVKGGFMRPHNGSANGGWKEYIPESKVLFQRAVSARVPLYRRQGIEFGTGYYPMGPKNTKKINYTQGSAYGFVAFRGKDPKKMQAALQAAVWSSRLDAGMIYAEEGGTPPSYKSIVESAEFKNKWQKDTESWPFFEALPGFVPYPNFPLFWDARTAINNQLLDIWAGKSNVKDGLAEANRQAQALLDRSLKGA